jgi:hypothetical protein
LPRTVARSEASIIRQTAVGDDDARTQQQASAPPSSADADRRELMRVATERILGAQADSAARLVDHALLFGARA